MQIYIEEQAITMGKLSDYVKIGFRYSILFIWAKTHLFIHSSL